MKAIKLLLKAAGAMAVIIILGVLVSLPFYYRDISRISNTLKAESKTMDSPYGTIEYVEIGKGTPILISHGTMGGYDLGVLQAQAFSSGNYRFIIPSRFGYLQSSMPSNHSFEAQADCFAYLLDRLGIDKAIVQGMSAGGPPALQFAIRHPEKCSGLILLSAITYAPPSLFKAQKLPIPDFMYRALLKSDYFFWTLLKVSPESMQNIFGATKELKAGSTKEEIDILNKMTKNFLPVSQRFSGWSEDGKNIDGLQEMLLDKIKVPTLIVSAKDDNIAPQVLSKYTAERIQGSQFESIESGGHVFLGHMSEVNKIVNQFIEKGIGKNN